MRSLLLLLLQLPLLQQLLFFIGTAVATDCTTSMSFDRTLSGTSISPTTLVLNVPVSLTNALEITVVPSSGSATSWSVSGSALVDPSVISTLGSTVVYTASSQTLTVTVGPGLGNAATGMMATQSGGLTGAALMCSAAFVLNNGENNYNRAIAGAATLAAVLSMNSLLVAADTCTSSGQVTIELPSGWIPTSKDISDANNGQYTYDLLFTQNPTPKPTQPTGTPTKLPTKAPTTKSPTDAPTTKSPTDAPTTKSPTNAPTASPTDSPTKAPTKAPTTKSPTTKAPTRSPTPPTPAPTNSPTLPFTALFNEINPGASTPFIEILAHKSIPPADITFYLYVFEAHEFTQVMILANQSTLSTWTSNSVCSDGILYNASFTVATFGDPSNDYMFQAVCAFGIIVSGAISSTELISFSSGVSLPSGTPFGSTPVVTQIPTTSFEIGGSYYEESLTGTISNIKSSTWTLQIGSSTNLTPGALNTGQTCN